MAIALITAFSSKVRPVSRISGRSCSLVRSRSVKFGPSNCANSRVLCWLRVARSKSIAPKFAVIPAGVERSRCESFNVTSSGALDFARDDNNLTCHERAPQTISIRSVRIQMAAPLGRAAAVSCAQSWRERFRSGETEILHPRHVSVSERRRFACGPSGRLHRHRHHRALQTDARIQRAASHGLGCIRFAGGAIRHQNGAASGDHTRENIAKFKTQLKRIGFSYDWSREISTADSKFYRWTQWVFLQIYNSWFNPETKKAEPISTYRGDDPDSVRLAYVAEVPVNWCPDLGTVLANEEVIDGKSEVGGFPVVRRPMRQWMLRITAFADRLLHELEGLDWPAGIKLLQRNWIGKSEGAEIDFKIDKHEEKIRVFTTRPDTLYGGTFLVLAPEHPLIDLIVTNEQWPAIREYREKTARKSDLERAELTKEKTGVFTG